MKKTLVILTLASTLYASGVVVAHEGHEHHKDKIMGNVVQIHTAAPVTHIDVKTSSGETVVLTADQATKFTREGKAATLAEVKVGMRVVATVTHDENVTKALEISLGAVDANKDKPRSHEH